MKKNIFQIGLIALILLFYLILLCQPIQLLTADLGRHLKNGELFFKNFEIPRTNLYSYTFPDFPFLNHHWGAGVVFYALQKFFGFSGLSLIFILLGLITFLIFFDIPRRDKSFAPAALISLLALPLLASRPEIRPEIFSYFFSGLFLWILWNFREQKISPKWLWALPFLEILWANLHIYFFFGLIIILAFLMEEIFGNFFNKRPWENVRRIRVIFGSAILATLINPVGLRGALYPLRIFDNYGYRLFENQSIWFIEKLFPYPAGFYFKALLGIFILGWIIKIIRVFRKKEAFSLALFLLSAFFGFLALKAIRNFAIFGYFALTISALNFQFLEAEKKLLQNRFALLLLFFLSVTLLFAANPSFWENRGRLGLGLEDKTNLSADFFKSQNIKGPIFNNYDIGGYLIYHLYPQEKVFVDNRPEAYPSSFFTEEYIPMQEDDKKWEELDKKYNFNAIYFYIKDLTTWAQKFLATRIQDKKWAPVFADDYAIIFLKRNEQNKSVIARFEIPEIFFSTK